LIASMLLFYFTPLIVFAMTTHICHVLKDVHFTLLGYHFINVIVGIDPMANRPTYAMRLELMFVTMLLLPFYQHAIFSMYFIINVIIGIDPSANLPAYAMRLVLMFATMIFHAFCGVAIISMKGLIGAPFFGQLGLSWGVDAALDQRIAGEITWGVGEFPCLAL